jgi:hypothetical protein
VFVQQVMNFPVHSNLPGFVSNADRSLNGLYVIFGVQPTFPAKTDPPTSGDTDAELSRSPHLDVAKYIYRHSDVMQHPLLQT